MKRLIISCFLFIAGFNSLFSIETSYVFEGTSKGSLLIEAESKQQVVVQNYSLENISDKVIRGIFLSINDDREKQKKLMSCELLDKNNLWKWWKLHQPTIEKNGAYSSLVGSTLLIPSRDVPTHGYCLQEFFFDGKWQLIDNKQNLVYLSLDNHTVACYEDVADEPFLALRTKTTGLEGSYDFVKACSNFAHLDIFPAEFDSSNPSEEELQILWHDHQFDLYPHENISFSSNGTIEQTIILEERLQTSGVMNIKSAFPITQIVNNSRFAVTLENQNILLEPSQKHDFVEPLFTFDLNVTNNKGIITLICKATNMPQWKLGPNEINLGIEQNPSSAQLTLQYELYKDSPIEIPLIIANGNNHFDHIIPYFELNSKEPIPEKIWWQISLDKAFDFLIPNFQGIQDFTDTIQLDACTDTFFNPGEIYYFRIKGLHHGKWSDWSPAFEFTVSKPEQIKNPIFKKLCDNQYQISWEPALESDTHYLIFASNAFDFMPSIYATQQYNIIDPNDAQCEQVNNLIATTAECSIKIGTEYAFYRIVSERQGQYSIPSPIIRVYDYGLSIPRSVMQATFSDSKTYRAERLAFPPPYPHLQMQNNLSIQSHALDTAHLHKDYYTLHPHVDYNVWIYLQPYFLPENHPVKPKLDRLFSKRVTKSSATLKKAGFTQPNPKKFSKTIVSKNKDIPGYIFKLFSDEQKEIYNWRQLFNRVTGALYIQDALNRYNINHMFVVPSKWIYPLPGEPSPPANLDRKNFIVVENLLDIYMGKENNKMWQSPIINSINLTWVYLLLSELGLDDSPYSFNMPITKDHRIAFIDTEHHHRWPVPFFKLLAYLSPEMSNHWKMLIENGGP